MVFGEAGKSVFKQPETMAEPEVNDSAEWVHLNVGGKKFTTTVSTLTRHPDSMLGRMFGGNYGLKRRNGYVYIDRDGKFFGYILRWLRDAFVPVLDPRIYTELLVEAEYYQLNDLKAAIQEILLQCNADLTRKDLIGMIQCMPSMDKDLAPFSFRGFNLSGQDFSMLNLQEACLEETCLHYTKFQRTRLQNANLLMCDAPSAVFDNAMMRWTYLSGGKFTGASFVAARLEGAVAEKSIFDFANCQRVIFTSAELSGASFEEANLSDANFDFANLLGCNFRDAKLADASMKEVDLSGADLSGADLSGANLQDATLIGAILANVDLQGTRLLNADMRGAEMSKAIHQVARYAGAKLAGI